MDNASPNLSLEFRGPVVIATLTDEKILDEDQLQGLAWKFLIPLALANIVVTGVLKVVF